MNAQLTLSVALVFVLCIFCMVTTTLAAFSFTALPFDYNGVDLHFFAVIGCGTETIPNAYCLPTTKYKIAGPTPECSSTLAAHILWTDSSDTILLEKSLQPFDMHVQSPFFDHPRWENATVKLYLIISKDTPCALPTTPQSTDIEYKFVVDEVEVATTTQIIATSPYVQALRTNEVISPTAALKLSPAVEQPQYTANEINLSTSMVIDLSPLLLQERHQFTTQQQDPASKVIEYNIFLPPISQFDKFDSIELIPTGIFQLTSTTARYMQCVFFYADASRDWLVLEYKQSPNGSYLSYLLPFENNTLPNISTSIPIRCFTPAQSTKHYVPREVDELNGLILRFDSTTLTPPTQVLQFGLKSTKTAQILQFINTETQFGPKAGMYDNFFSHSEPLTTFFSRYIEFTNATVSLYNSVYQFQHPMITPDLDSIERTSSHMFPCLIENQYQLLISTVEFGLLDSTTTAPTFDEVKKQITSAQFTVTCHAISGNKAHSQHLVWIGAFEPYSLELPTYLSTDSLPSYPMLVLNARTEREIDGFATSDDYKSCSTYQLNLFIELAIPTTSRQEFKLPSDDERTRGTFFLRTGYKYAASPLFQPYGGVFRDTTYYTMQKPGEASKQRFVSNDKLNVPMLENPADKNAKVHIFIDSSIDDRNDELIHIKHITIQPPQHSGTGIISPTTPDTFFQITILSPTFLFHAPEDDSSAFPTLKCTWKPEDGSIPAKDITVTVSPYFLTVNAVLQDENNSLTKPMVLTCHSHELTIKHHEVAETAHAAHSISLLVRQPSIVTAHYTQIQLATAIQAGHILRNVAIFLGCLVIIGLAIFAGLKIWKKRQVAKASSQTEVTDTLPETQSGYDNLEA